MGILNVTPDSFFSDSRYTKDKAIADRVEQIINEGAKIIDIGGYSSRPGAKDVTPEEEYQRLARGLEIIKSIAPEAIISVDTFRAEVARRCKNDWDVDIINDISGGTLDEHMIDTVAELQMPYILMHMRGTPATMQQFTQYKDVTNDVINELSEKITLLRSKGIKDIIVDPGFGFSKTLEQNYEMINNLEMFHSMNLPILVGISRKSMIYKALELTPETALNGTTVLNTIATLKGTHILRVHDVKEAVETVKKNTRHYAKKQLTWFRRYDKMNWLDISKFTSDDEAIEDMKKWIRTKL
jgi:dihydropteroate synthase